MRIALVVERFEPGGGVEGAAWRVAHGLAERGEQVSVIARRAQPSDTVPRIAARVPERWQPLRVWAFARAARRIAQRGAFDLVHSFSRMLAPDLYRAGGGSHADYLERAYAGNARRLRLLSPRHRVLLHLEATILRRPGQWIQCNSKLVREQLLGRYALAVERVVVVYNGVDLERFHPDRHREARAALRAARGAGDAAVWLLLGSGFERKGLATALAALAHSRARDTALWVAGRDDPRPWRARATRLGIADRVHFLGAVDAPERVLAAADALLLPTRYDAFANASLEAAASGLPVITSACNGAAEILGDGGFVVERPDDWEGFAAALDDIEAPADRRKRGSLARRRAEAFGWDRHLDELQALYARIRAR